MVAFFSMKCRLCPFSFVSCCLFQHFSSYFHWCKGHTVAGNEGTDSARTQTIHQSIKQISLLSKGLRPGLSICPLSPSLSLSLSFSLSFQKWGWAENSVTALQPLFNSLQNTSEHAHAGLSQADCQRLWKSKVRTERLGGRGGALTVLLGGRCSTGLTL